MDVQSEGRDMPPVDYSPAGMLRQTVEQCIGMIDSTIMMDPQPMPAMIEARFAQLRRMLRGGLVAASLEPEDGDNEDPPAPTPFQDRHRWTFRVDGVASDGLVEVSADGRDGRRHMACLMRSTFQDLDVQAGMDVTVRLVDDGRFVVALADDAPPARNDTNPSLHRRDVEMLERLVRGVSRPRTEASGRNA